MASEFFFVLNVGPGGYAMLLTAADASKVDRRIKACHFGDRARILGCCRRARLAMMPSYRSACDWSANHAH
jgi:hypothetical protein